VLLTLGVTGPVTDYGSTIVHWMRNRQPRFKGGYQGEMERPSPSYIVDVCDFYIPWVTSIITLLRYCRHYRDFQTLQTRFLQSIFMTL
jgi:hypothetical protein